MLRRLQALAGWFGYRISRLGLWLLDFAREPGGSINSGWAVVVGINHYDSFKSLQKCVSDAISFYILLTDPSYGGFDPARVALLVDGTPAEITKTAITVVKNLEDLGIDSRNGIIQEIAMKAQQPALHKLDGEISRVARFSATRELMLVYLAGHGLPIPKRVWGFFPIFRSYFLPPTAQLADLDRTALPLPIVMKKMRSSRATQKLLIFDACYPVLDRIASKLRFRRSADVLAGSRELEPVVEGVFTFHLIEAMAQQIETENDGCVNLRDAYRHVRRCVPETIFNAIGTPPSQLPVLRATRDRELILSGNRNGFHLPARLNRRAVGATSLFVIAIVGTVLMLNQENRPDKDVRIAVLPIRAPASAADLAFGIGDYITARLSTWDQIRLASNAAIRATPDVLRNTSDVHKLSATLGVTFVLHGNLQIQGQQLRIVLNLENASENKAVWNRAFQGSQDRLFDVEDEIYASLIKELKLAGHQTPGRELRARTLEVSDLFMKGKRLSQEKPTRESLQEAANVLRQAIERDPDFVPAYAQLSRTYWQLYQRTKDSTWLDEAERMAIQAVSSPQQFMEAHLARADVYTARGQTQNALKELDQALALAPNSDEVARSMGRLYQQTGLADQSIEAFRKAVSINPSYWNNHFQLGNALIHFDKNSDALCSYNMVVKLSPEQPEGYEGESIAYLNLGQFNLCIKASDNALKYRRRAEVLSNKGTSQFYVASQQSGSQRKQQFESARRSFEEAFALNSNDELLCGNVADSYRALNEVGKANLQYQQCIELANTELRSNPQSAKALGSKALYLSRTGRIEQAVRIIREAIGLNKNVPTLLYNEALIYAIARQNEEALDALAKACELGMQTEMAKAEPDFETLRHNPRFSELISRYAKQTQTNRCQE